MQILTSVTLPFLSVSPMLPVRIQRALIFVLVKSDLPGNIALVRVKFSLTRIPRVEWESSVLIARRIWWSSAITYRCSNTTAERIINPPSAVSTWQPFSLSTSSTALYARQLEINRSFFELLTCQFYIDCTLIIIIIIIIIIVIITDWVRFVALGDYTYDILKVRHVLCSYRWIENSFPCIWGYTSMFIITWLWSLLFIFRYRWVPWFSWGLRRQCQLSKYLGLLLLFL